MSSLPYHRANRTVENVDSERMLPLVVVTLELDSLQLIVYVLDRSPREGPLATANSDILRMNYLLNYPDSSPIIPFAKG